MRDKLKPMYVRVRCRCGWHGKLHRGQRGKGAAAQEAIDHQVRNYWRDGALDHELVMDYGGQGTLDRVE